MNSKVGTFDWIIDFGRLKYIIDDICSGSKYVSIEDLKVLVVGCGTSNLSENLYSYGFRLIDSVDNDQSCIEHMKLNCSQYGDSMKWFHYDIVTLTGNDQNYFASQSNGYDIIVDKGTFDAILVGGLSTPMILEINRLLRHEIGTYLLCSIFSIDILQPVFTIPEFQLSCSFQSQPSADSDQSTCTIMTANKISDISTNISISAIQEKESSILDQHFKKEAPLLTMTRETEIRNTLLTLHVTGPYLIQDVYENIFHEIFKELGYTYELFLDDLKSFPTQVPLHMTADEVIEFIRIMQ